MGPEYMRVIFAIVFLAVSISICAQIPTHSWNGYARNAQHTSLSNSASQALSNVLWSTPVDTTTPGGPIFVHYGSVMVTPTNTVLVPVKTMNGTAVAFEVQAFGPRAAGTSPTPLYTLTTDYTLPPHIWIPSYGPTLTTRNRLYYAGAGGTVYYRDHVDSATGSTGQIAFYGDLSVYLNNQADFNDNVQVSTPLVSDREGNVYFGFTVVSGNPGNLNLANGVARISASGVGSWVSAASTAGGDTEITQVPLNCAPALSNDEHTLYFATATGASGSDGNRGYLVSVDSATLAPTGHVALVDPNTLTPAQIYSDSSSAPTVGPDGDVYYGVLENPCCASHNDRGWLLHFDSTLTQVKVPGSFGWDTTASIVPRSLVPSYTGPSSYLILTKYNNYLGIGTGDGINKVAVLDPNVVMADPVIREMSVMKEVISVTGTGSPQKEWCINSAAIDPFTRSAIINSEDGNVYRWDFVKNTLSEHFSLNAPVGEGYTPTMIGPDGTVYAINDAVLYALGKPRVFVPHGPASH